MVGAVMVRMPLVVPFVLVCVSVVAVVVAIEDVRWNRRHRG